ncbi:MAG: thioredoxin [Planctomycetota bacterium]|nr:MAG: thioredoxin [Planctomycetota bacterium]REJ89039.1 MAG: thioredoxin [Planctomycetota bacterium]REK29022.1 MAG: thioredoxin [Planctomycetota bacterium]REK39548.1 MAG: thioredoxin [Planctomycetota bacterium]
MPAPRTLLVKLSLAVVASLSTAGTAHAQSVGVAQIMKYRPVQKDVDIGAVAEDQYDQCEVKVEREGKSSGWAVFGPEGQILRRFVDTDGDNVVDHWRYYKDGLEVYRDIDTNADNDVDQSRWLNRGGSRWGIDADQDGKIEKWKMISAEEATREAVMAMASGDVPRLAAVLINSDDLKQLGVSGDAAEELLNPVQDPAAKLRQVLSQSKTFKSSSRWARFDSSTSMPNVIPAESGLSEDDLLIYENVMSIVETGGETGFVQVGEMVRVGDVWKLTSIPQPLEGEAPQLTDSGGFTRLLVAGLSTTMAPAEGSPEFRKVIEQLQELDGAAPQPTGPKPDLVAYNSQRAQLLGRLAEIAGTAEERLTWRQQQIDQIAAAVQLDAFKDGVETLRRIEQQIREQNPDSPLVSYVVYRRMTAEYNAQLLQADAAQRVEVQANWLRALEGFIGDYPESDDAADAMLQIAMAEEFAGNHDNAREWYGKIVDEHPKSPAQAVAAGALKRLTLEGKPLALSGPALSGGTIDISRYRGKVVAVLFWATWCRPCTEDLPQIQELYRQHRAAGFEVIGVNVDVEGAPIQEYIQQHKVAWPSIHEKGGLQGGAAQQYGVITLPTTFLVDKTGKVVSSAASVADLKEKVPELVKQ